LGCGYICQEDFRSEECITCLEPCNQVFDTCSGLERPAVTYPGEDEGSNGTTATSAPTTQSLAQETNAETCARQQEGVDAESVDEYYIAYELQFFSAIKTAWNSDAKLLAVIVVVFSGIWPYTKNVILALAWYLPLSVQRRDWVMMWLRRLGKYTLIDIYVSMHSMLRWYCVKILEDWIRQLLLEGAANNASLNLTTGDYPHYGGCLTGDQCRGRSTFGHQGRTSTRHYCLFGGDSVGIYSNRMDRGTAREALHFTGPRGKNATHGARMVSRRRTKQFLDCAWGHVAALDHCG
jgi:hypothetical protein